MSEVASELISFHLSISLLSPILCGWSVTSLFLQVYVKVDLGSGAGAVTFFQKIEIRASFNRVGQIVIRFNPPILCTTRCLYPPQNKRCSCGV
jgi:hypothetical protein